MLKQSLALFLALVLMLGLTACDKQQQETLMAQIESDVLNSKDIVSASEEEITSESIDADGSELSASTLGKESHTVVSSDVSGSSEFAISAVVSGSSEFAISAVVSGSSELAISAVVSSESSTVDNIEAGSSTESIASTVPIDYSLYSKPVQALLSWLEKGGDGLPGNQSFLQAAEGRKEILIPVSTRSDLENRTISVVGNTRGCIFDFYTNVSDVLLENEWYAVQVVFISEEEAQKDLKEHFYPSETNKKLGVYNGMEYAYFDGYEGEDRFSSVDTAAWFIQDGFLIKITALYVNNYKPWNNAWFDYFEFETVTF